MNIRSIVRNAVCGFVNEWKVGPYRWLYEVDIQRELAQRLMEQLPQNSRTIRAVHTQEMSQENLFSRVTCQPYVKFSPNERAIHPDIVIWDDCIPPAVINSTKQAHPILWACEIKYDFTDKEHDKDKHRLISLLKTKTAKNATQLLFVQNKSDRDEMPDWDDRGFTCWKFSSK